MGSSRMSKSLYFGEETDMGRNAGFTFYYQAIHLYSLWLSISSSAKWVNKGSVLPKVVLISILKKI